MTLDRSFTFHAFGQTCDIDLAVGSLMLGIWWEASPRSGSLILPFISFSIEGTDDRRSPWQWCWSLFRLTIWKTEFRLDVDLNFWAVGLNCLHLDDFSLHLGPFNVQIETDKSFAHDDEVPIKRFLVPPRTYIHPWPVRCRCCPPRDRLQCDDVTDFAVEEPL